MLLAFFNHPWQCNFFLNFLEKRPVVIPPTLGSAAYTRMFKYVQFPINRKALARKTTT